VDETQNIILTLNSKDAFYVM